MERKLRVIHTIMQLDRVRGSTSWILEAVRNPNNYPLEHHILACSPTPGDREQEFTDLGIPVYRIPLNTRMPVAFIAKARKLFQKLRPDILHAHTSMLAGYECLAARLAGVPRRIVYFHSGEWLFGKSLLNRALAPVIQTLTIGCATDFWGASEAVVRRWVPNCPRGKSRRAVHGGIQLRGIPTEGREEYRGKLGVPDDAPLIGHIGRFTDEKNHIGVLKTFAIIFAERSDAHLVFLGEGPLMRSIKEASRRLTCADRVHYPGVVGDVHGYLAAMDILLFPSKHEALGLVVLEAQDAGLPVVASNVPGLSEALCPEWKQLCRPPADYMGLAQSAEQLLWNPRKHRPDEFLEHFSAASAGKRLYEEYLSG